MNTQRILGRDDALIIRRLAENMPALPGAEDIGDTLLDLVAHATVTASPAHDHVGLGSEVDYGVAGVAGTQTVTIVLPDEADVRAGRISLFTPVAIALLGLPAGGRATLTLPNGQQREVTVKTTRVGLQPAA